MNSLKITASLWMGQSHVPHMPLLLLPHPSQSSQKRKSSDSLSINAHSSASSTEVCPLKRGGPLAKLLNQKYLDKTVLELLKGIGGSIKSQAAASII